MDELGGYSIIDLIESIKGPRKGPSPKVREFLNGKGNMAITKMFICRTPINAGIEAVINLISLGQFQRNKSKLNYDKLFHLFIVILLHNGEHYRIEKNEVVVIEKIKYNDINNTECINIPIKKSITTKQLLSNAENYQGSDFWLYDARDNNCQVFVLSCLVGSGLGTSQDYKFIKQDASQLLSGASHKISRFITDLAARFDIFKYGKGLII